MWALEAQKDFLSRRMPQAIELLRETRQGGCHFLQYEAAVLLPSQHVQRRRQEMPPFLLLLISDVMLRRLGPVNEAEHFSIPPDLNRTLFPEDSSCQLTACLRLVSLI
jgi:hypothetical protein